MNPRFNKLQPYPFAKVRSLLSGVAPNPDLSPIRLSIGEPEHRPPQFIQSVMNDHFDDLRKYPPTSGSAALKTAISDWAKNRFKLEKTALDPDSMVLPCNGTREALFAIVQTLVDASKGDLPLVMMPNPFYQIYEGAALLADAEPRFINNSETTQQPNFDEISADDWQRCQLLFICTPGNPSGLSLPLSQLKRLIALADEHDFVIASDECYSELYLDEDQPVPGLLQACEELGRANFERCLVFHSLSKRSNLAGLRSGFVAGDPDLLRKFLLYRTYHGSAMSLQVQAASAAAWSDEEHVKENRALYRAKYASLCPLLEGTLDFDYPDAGFYLWLKTPLPDTELSLNLYRNQHLSVLPGSFLSRDTVNGNPGENRVRLALVSPLEVCEEGVARMLAEVARG